VERNNGPVNQSNQEQTKQMAQEKRFKTPRGRLSFPYVFEPREAENPGDMQKFSLSLILDAEAQKTPQWAAIKAEVATLAAAKFGVDVKQPDGTVKRVVPKGVRNPIRDGAEKLASDGVTPMEGYGPGTVFISATSAYAPGVIGGDMKPCGPEEVYAGCYVRASLTVYAYERKDGKGVTFGLRNVQKLGDGESLAGGGGDPAKDFEPVEGFQRKAGTPAAAEFAQSDDPIPF